MNILYLTISVIRDISERGLYQDLIRTLAERGHSVAVYSPLQSGETEESIFAYDGRVVIHKVKTATIVSKQSLISKGVKTLTIGSKFIEAIKNKNTYKKIDVVLYATPPITFNKVIYYIKQKFNPITYLMLKDIFPQNAVDIKLLSKYNPITKYFRAVEKKLYNMSDHIGCMSKANVDYLLNANPFINPDKVEVFPNSVDPDLDRLLVKSDMNLSNQLLTKDSIVFMFAGNIGKPQAPAFIEQIMMRFSEVPNSTLLIVGSGTEFERLVEASKRSVVKNVIISPKLPKGEYDELAKRADVGVIFLDHRFTIPNYPSRLTSYMELGIPILAATDCCTDVRNLIEDNNMGLWSESNNVDRFLMHAVALAEDKELRSKMGKQARKYLLQNLDINQTVEIILKHMEA